MTSRLEINLSRLTHNLDALRQRTVPAPVHDGDGPARASGAGTGACKVCATVKKDAYGLGAVPISHRLMKAGVQMLAVYEPDEARQLVAGAVTLPILVLSPMHELGRTDVLYRHAVAGKLHLSLHDLRQAEAVNTLGHTFGIRLPVHPYLDTGMSRSGLSRAQLDGLLGSLGEYPFLDLAGMWTHFATGDNDPDFLAEQMEQFEAAVAANSDHLSDGMVLHAANTFATLRDRRYHLDMIRPGLGLYGYGPEWLDPTEPALPGPELQPIVRWLSQLTHVQQYSKGDSVGYNRLHKLRRKSVVGVVPVGYGDGYPVALSNKGVVRLLRDDGDPLDCPVLGKVSMDQITIDLTDAMKALDLDEPATLLAATVEVYGNEPAAPNAVSTLAKAIGTHSYELQCRLATHIKREYVD